MASRSVCRQCIHDRLLKVDSKCPTCGVSLGAAPLEKLRPDHSLQHIRSKIFPAKRRNVNAVSATDKKRKENVSTISSEVDINIMGGTTREEQEIEVEVINEADEASLAEESVYESSVLNVAPVGRDALSRISCRDFSSACHLNAETGALITWQPAVAHDQLAPWQVPQTVQDDNNLRGEILALFNENTAKIMRMYDAHIDQLKAENFRITEQLENGRSAALERIRMLEERHQQELEKERAAAAERTRIMLEERHHQELKNERAVAAERIRDIGEKLQRESEKNAKLSEDLKNGKAENRALVLEIVEKNNEFATLKYYCDMVELDKTDLQNQVENLKEESESIKKEYAEYVGRVMGAAGMVPDFLKQRLPLQPSHG